MAAFAVESAVDELAHKIGMDPVASSRIKNAAKEGSKSSYGPVYGPIGIGPTLEAVQEASAHEGAARQEPGAWHGMRILVQLRRPDMH